MNIGARIRRRREELGLSQDELARAVGYASRSSIAKIENDGRGLPQKKIQQIADALQVSPGFLMGWESGPDDDTYQHYYLNPETQKIGQEIYENKDLRLLFDAARDASPEDLKTVHDVLKALKAKEQGDYD